MCSLDLQINDRFFNVPKLNFPSEKYKRRFLFLFSLISNHAILENSKLQPNFFYKLRNYTVSNYRFKICPENVRLI